MGILTRNEETILIALCRLKGQTHGPALREKLIELTGKPMVYGTLYNSLEYLIRKGFVISKKGKPSPERGGKRKSIYTITPEGREALLETRRLNTRLWKDMSEADIKSRGQSK
ncbi:MAG: PadR family transcriptional regulator [Candidatus Aminicenantes bacterium]|nr:PadR family transcriptional regulator [Candidatus Aminicenantes bacterium]